MIVDLKAHIWNREFPETDKIVLFSKRVGVGDKAWKRNCSTYFSCILFINMVRAPLLFNNPFYKLRGWVYITASVPFNSFYRLRGSVYITDSVPFNSFSTLRGSVYITASVPFNSFSRLRGSTTCKFLVSKYFNGMWFQEYNDSPDTYMGG